MMSMRVATEGASHDDCPCEGEEDGPSTCPGDDPAKQESRTQPELVGKFLRAVVAQQCL